MEICLNDEWGTVCDQMWDKADAGVVCRQLGLNLAGITIKKVIYYKHNPHHFGLRFGSINSSQLW